MKKCINNLSAFSILFVIQELISSNQMEKSQNLNPFVTRGQQALSYACKHKSLRHLILRESIAVACQETKCSR